MGGSSGGGKGLGAGGGKGVLSAVAPIIGNLMSDTSEPPAPAPAPPVPTLAPAPAIPPVASTAQDVKSQEAIVDTEAAQIRASKRRKNALDTNLFSLTSADNSASVLTKSLLGSDY